LPSKKSKPKSAKGLKIKKGTTQRKPTKPASRQKSALPESTYDVWLEQQVKERVRHPLQLKSESSKKMPADTFQTWLKNQHVVERQARAEVTAPAGTYEEWIRKRVAESRSKTDEEKRAQPNAGKVAEGLSVSA
jgi:hypothetical protein